MDEDSQRDLSSGQLREATPLMARSVSTKYLKASCACPSYNCPFWRTLLELVVCDPSLCVRTVVLPYRGDRGETYLSIIAIKVSLTSQPLSSCTSGISLNQSESLISRVLNPLSGHHWKSHNFSSSPLPSSFNE